MISLDEEQYEMSREIREYHGRLLTNENVQSTRRWRLDLALSYLADPTVTRWQFAGP